VARGRFITFEGGEGAGKSTQIRRLGARLEAAGVEVVVTREPGGSPGAETIRELLVNGDADRWSPTTEALLMYAARRDHLERTIRPALARGAVVLCDRFADSTRAYQGAGGKLSLEAIAALEGFALEAGDWPDLTLILDLPVAEGLKRAASRGGGEARFESKGLAFHERLRAGYLAIAEREPQRCAVVDATGDMDAVAQAVWTAFVARGFV
jgi:dTMP kinase